MLKFLYFGPEWDDRWRRKQRLAYELSRQAQVTSMLYVAPPVQTSVLDWLRGQFAASYLGQDRRAHWQALTGQPRQIDDKVRVLTTSDKTIPLTRSAALRRLGVLQRFNRWFLMRSIKRALRQMPGDQLVLWLCHPLQVFALDAFPERVLACYDWTDDWTQFDLLPVKDGQQLIEWNDLILRQVDVVFAVSNELYQRACAVNPHTYRAPNATDLSALGPEDAAMTCPPDLAVLPRPIAGYIGQIGDKIDYAMIQTLAKARPAWSFVFVGNIWQNHRHQVDALSDLPNVFFLGQRGYHELGAYLTGFDVCIMPHLCNALTLSMDPIKLYDYLASGKPIVSTPVAGVDRFDDVVYVGETSEEFIAGLDEAMREDGHLTAKRLAYAQENSWPRRAEEMWAALKARLAL